MAMGELSCAGVCGSETRPPLGSKHRLADHSNHSDDIREFLSKFGLDYCQKYRVITSPRRKDNR